MFDWGWLINPAATAVRGVCLAAAPGVLVMHAASDTLNGLAYLSIPAALIIFSRRRPDVSFAGLGRLFVGVVLAGGATKLLAAATLATPFSGAEPIVRLLAALLSFAAALLFWPLVPRMARLPSAAQLEALNATLHQQTQTVDQIRADGVELRGANIELERRVAERTAELSTANARLTALLAQRDSDQQALALSEAEFRASFEASAVGKALWEPKTIRFLRANRALATMLGYGEEELASVAGADGFQFIAPDDRVAAAIGFGQLVTGELDVFVGERRFLKKDGSSLWCRAAVTLVRDPESGEPIMGISEIADISENRRARDAQAAAQRELEKTIAERTEALAQRTADQQALALSEAQFRASFEAAAVGKAQWDPMTGRLLRANRALATMLGYGDEDLSQARGSDGVQFVSEDDRQKTAVGYMQLLTGEKHVLIEEKRFLKKDGSALWCRSSMTFVRDPQTGEPILGISEIEDLDEYYRVREALLVGARELEQTVAERTEALAQRDLLLREVYHRVKNNLQIVDSMLVMKARRVSDPEAKEALLALRGRIYALGLVHHQLMNSGNLKTFDAAPFLHELSTNIVDAGSARDVSLTVRAVPLEVGLDFGIPLGLLVTELVTNSLKHAFPEGRGAIDVCLGRGRDGAIALTVSDDGVGFERPQPSVGPAGGGFGTRIVDGLVAQLKGTLSMRNDDGARIEIRLPAPVAA